MVMKRHIPDMAIFCADKSQLTPDVAHRIFFITLKPAVSWTRMCLHCISDVCLTELCGCHELMRSLYS